MKEPILYIIATPIGNLEDMTLRSLRILREEVAAIFCEDTRQTKKLLNHYEIHLQAFAVHSHSTDAAIDRALSYLQQGESIAYVTDCGTPSVSDPGNRLVAAARDAGFQVSPIPGASALTSIASVSGFAGKRIVFGGFLSKKEGRCVRELQELGAVPAIIIIYESPHRIHKTLARVAAVFPGRNVILGREMTKMFEEFITGTTDNLSQHPERVKAKGEFAIAIDNTSGQVDDDNDTEGSADEHASFSTTGENSLKN